MRLLLDRMASFFRTFGLFIARDFSCSFAQAFFRCSDFHGVGLSLAFFFHLQARVTRSSSTTQANLPLNAASE